MEITATNNLQPAPAETKADAEEAQKRREDLWQAAQQMEQMFLGMLLGQINKPREKDSLIHGGSGEEMFHKELNSAYAQRMASTGPVGTGGIGIAKVVYEQFIRQESQGEGIANPAAALRGEDLRARFAAAGMKTNFSAVG